MKIQLLSDLHLESNPDFVPQPALDADVLVLAGDIGSYQAGSLLADEDFGLARFSPLPPIMMGGCGRVSDCGEFSIILDINGGQEGSEGFKLLGQQIDAKTKSIGSMRAKYVELGGDFRKPSLTFI
mgnify:CR=1 FL=1